MKKIIFNPQFYLFFLWNVLVILLYLYERFDVTTLLIIYWVNSAVTSVFYVGYLIYRSTFYKGENKGDITMETAGTVAFILLVLFIFIYMIYRETLTTFDNFTPVYVATGAFVVGLIANLRFSNLIPALNTMPNQPLALIIIMRIIPFAVLLIVLFKFFPLIWAFIMAKLVIDFALFLLLELPYSNNK